MRRAPRLALAVFTILALTAGGRSASAGAVSPLPPVITADGRLALCDVLPGAPSASPTTSWAARAFEAGARINRWEFRWDQIEPKQNQWSWSGSDAVVQSDANGGLQTLGILIATPRWATAAGQRPGNGVPAGLYTPYRDPRNLWTSYVRSVVTRFAGKVRYWEIWNEPDLPFFWSGSTEDYFRLLKTAYLTIRDADPTGLVVVAGMVIPDLSFLSRVLVDDARDSGGPNARHYFDVVAWHAYGRAGQTYEVVSKMRQLLLSHGETDTEIWVTEAGFPASNPNGEPRQAAYIEQTAAFAFAAGASRVFVYRASDDPTAKAWGIMTATGAPRMGYVAFQVIANEFSGAQPVVYAPVAGAQRFVLYRADSRTVMMWSDSTRALEFKNGLAGPIDSVTDWQGAAVPAAAQASLRPISLPGAEYNAGIDAGGQVVGGPPIYVHQPNTAYGRLPLRAYVAPPSHAPRSLTIWNSSAAVSEIDVSALSDARLHQALQVPAHGLTTLDLDLIAGAQYPGLFVVRAGAPGIVAQPNGSESQGAAKASRRWWVPASINGLGLVNPSSSSASVRISAYDHRGRVVAARTSVLSPGSSTVTSPRSIGSTPSTTLRVASDHPLLLTSPDGHNLLDLPKPNLQYASLPAGLHRLKLFDPDAKVPVTITISGPDVQETADVEPLHTATVDLQPSRFIILTGNRPFLARFARDVEFDNSRWAPPVEHALYTGRAPVTIQMLSQTRSAHVNAIITDGPRTTVRQVPVQPGKLTEISVRPADGYPSTVSLNVDTPIFVFVKDTVNG